MQGQAQRRPFYRRTYLIDPHFQLSFVGYVVGVIIVCITAFYFADLYFFRQMVIQGQALQLPPEHIFFQIIQKQKLFMDKIFLFTGIIVFVFISIWGILLSHRIAGPLFRLNKYLQENAQANACPPMHFRRKDYFRNVADTFNKFLAGHKLLQAEQKTEGNR